MWSRSNTVCDTGTPQHVTQAHHSMQWSSSGAYISSGSWKVTLSFCWVLYSYNMHSWSRWSNVRVYGTNSIFISLEPSYLQVIKRGAIQPSIVVSTRQPDNKPSLLPINRWGPFKPNTVTTTIIPIGPVNKRERGTPNWGPYPWLRLLIVEDFRWSKGTQFT
jgi:hypothetical protein